VTQENKKIIQLEQEEGTIVEDGNLKKLYN
jgi:hypothetical protein